MAHTKSNMNTLRLSAIAALSIFSACGGSGSGAGGPVGNGFQLFSMTVQQDAIWQVNRPIDFVFSQDVDFSSVSLNTISIRDLNGLPASGAFTLVNSTTVRFQPTCPVLGDLSDSGFKIGGIEYQITVLGSASGSGLTVKSATGLGVKDAQLRQFVTPTSSLPAVAFADTQTGPPSPVVRELDSLGAALNPEDQVTYIESAGGAGADVEFTFDTVTQLFNMPLNQGLNLFSDSTTDVAVLIEFDQPVNPADANISSKRLFLEYLDDPLGAPTWKPLPTEVSLERNCTETGATIRLQPLGMLPQSTEIRAVISTEFEDLVGDRNQLQVDNFAHFESTIINFAGLTPATDMGDEFKEDFNLVGFEDQTAPFSEPRAIWGDGALVAAFSFSGTGGVLGGVDGEFDWVIPSGVTILLDTSGAVSIAGGDIGADMMTPFVQSKTRTVVAGKVDVRHLVVEAGAVIKVQGVNPVQIQASGNVVVEGLIDVSGFDRPDVATLNTGNQPEVGSAGSAGGGTGGTGSFLTTTSTPQGGNGFGPFTQANFGGKGGESGFGLPGLNNRRGGGGGGGILGPDSLSTNDNAGVTFGMIAQPGFNGHPTATGSISNAKPPKGGVIGNSPFIDSASDNDFFGTKFDQGQNKIIIGELPSPWAGGGGGAGGDAVKDNVFPHSSWTAFTDEKASGGAGGAGSLRILCLGTVTIRGAGQIHAKGGAGGAGENTINTNHLGGGGGGGAGGHVIIEAGSAMIFDGVDTRAIKARGGQGGKGVSGNGSVNAGGAGGPGIIQVHVLDPTNDIQFVNADADADTLDEVTWPDAITLVPSFGARSRAITKWIPVGQASVEPDGIADQITFLFGGTDTTTGSILDFDDDDLQDDVAPIAGPTTLVGGNISVDGRSLTFDAQPLANTFNDVYLRNPQLLRDSLLLLNEVGNESEFKRFNVASASFDLPGMTLTLEVDGAPAQSLLTFAPGGAVEFSLIPVSLSASTVGGAKGAYPNSVDIQVRFQSAGVGPDGLPDLGTAGFQDWTPDIGLVNAKGAGTVEFIRLEVLFDLDALGGGLSAASPRPLLDFARIGWRF
ncbi:MAG: hypothetical protein ACJAZ8_001075 [Planctomycetota bacterium]|jgi:hypothetical protein